MKQTTKHYKQESYSACKHHIFTFFFTQHNIIFSLFFFTLPKTSSKTAMTWQRRPNYKRISSLGFFVMQLSSFPGRRTIQKKLFHWNCFIADVKQQKAPGGLYFYVLNDMSSKRVKLSFMLWDTGVNWRAKPGERTRLRQGGTTVGKSELIEWIWRLCSFSEVF